MALTDKKEEWADEDFAAKGAQLREIIPEADKDKIWRTVEERLEKQGFFSRKEAAARAAEPQAPEPAADAHTATAPLEPAQQAQQAPRRPARPWLQRTLGGGRVWLRAAAVAVVAALIFFAITTPSAAPVTTGGFELVIQRVRDAVIFWDTPIAEEDWNAQMKHLAQEAPWFVAPRVPAEYRPLDVDAVSFDASIRLIHLTFENPVGARLIVVQWWREDVSQWEVRPVHDGNIQPTTVSGREAYWVTWEEQRSLLVWMLGNVELRLHSPESLEVTVNLAEAMTEAHESRADDEGRP